MLTDRTSSAGRAPVRHVYILGHDAPFDAQRAARSAVEEGASVVLLCIGRSLTRRQRDQLAETMRLSSEGSFDLEVEWILGPEQLRQALAAGDRQLSLLLDDRERRRIAKLSHDPPA